MAPLAVFLLLLLLLQGAAAAEKRSYVVYLGEHGAAEEMAAGLHHDLLAAAVLGEKEKAIFYSHSKEKAIFIIMVLLSSIFVCLVKGMLRGFTCWYYEAEHNRFPLRHLCKLLHCLLRFAAKFAIFVVRFAWQIITELVAPLLGWFIDELKHAELKHAVVGTPE